MAGCLLVVLDKLLQFAALSPQPPIPQIPLLQLLLGLELSLGILLAGREKSSKNVRASFLPSTQAQQA